MLASKLGIRLVLWMGKTVPRPAPAEALNALTDVEITNDVEQPGDGFQLTFTLAKNKTGEYGLLQSGALDPDSRVIIGVVLGVTLEALIDGVIYHHQLSPGDQPGTSTLAVSGRDVSVMLDLEETDAAYANQPDSVIVTGILKNYARYGIGPAFQVTPTSEVPIEAERIPGQHETDLKYIQRLARRNGFVFYIEPVTMGVNKAYWGPEDRTGLSQPALSYDLGPSTNVKTLRFLNDALAPIDTSGSLVEPITKQSIRIPALPALRVPPLALSAGPARRTQRLRCTAHRNFAQASSAATAAVTGAPEPVSAEGELDTVRYGSVLRPRRKVGVRGVGRSYNGDYFVQRVKHRIQVKQGVYTQTFTLSREGTGTLTPAVRAG
jgi:hypothetical protein